MVHFISLHGPPAEDLTSGPGPIQIGAEPLPRFTSHLAPLSLPSEPPGQSPLCHPLWLLTGSWLVSLLGLTLNTLSLTHSLTHSRRLVLTSFLFLPSSSFLTSAFDILHLDDKPTVISSAPLHDSHSNQPNSVSPRRVRPN